MPLKILVKCFPKKHMFQVPVFFKNPPTLHHLPDIKHWHSKKPIRRPKARHVSFCLHNGHSTSLPHRHRAGGQRPQRGHGTCDISSPFSLRYFWKDPFFAANFQGLILRPSKHLDFGFTKTCSKTMVHTCTNCIWSPRCSRWHINCQAAIRYNIPRTNEAARSFRVWCINTTWLWKESCEQVNMGIR